MQKKREKEKKMKDYKEIARTLAGITQEEWEAILIASECVDQPSVENLEEVAKAKEVREEKDLEVKILNLLKEIGIPTHILGYNYLGIAIKLVLEDKEYADRITKKLYPEIAKMVGSTTSRVERAIRHAITIAFDVGNPDVHEKVFWGLYSPLKGKPTNAHAITALAEYIRVYS